jgi:hypothetical protein
MRRQIQTLIRIFAGLMAYSSVGRYLFEQSLLSCMDIKTSLQQFMQGYYELGIDNHTPNKQIVVCRTLYTNGKLIGLQSVDLAPRRSHFFRATPQHIQHELLLAVVS